jgi:hypothetical protein
VKHDLKGVLKYIGVEILTYFPSSPTIDVIDALVMSLSSQTVTDAPAKPKVTAGLARNMHEFKIPMLCPSFTLTTTYYN